MLRILVRFLLLPCLLVMGTSTECRLGISQSVPSFHSDSRILLDQTVQGKQLITCHCQSDCSQTEILVETIKTSRILLQSHGNSISSRLKLQTILRKSPRLRIVCRCANRKSIADYVDIQESPNRHRWKAKKFDIRHKALSRPKRNDQGGKDPECPSHYADGNQKNVRVCLEVTEKETEIDGCKPFRITDNDGRQITWKIKDGNQTDNCSACKTFYFVTSKTVPFTVKSGA